MAKRGKGMKVKDKGELKGTKGQRVNFSKGVNDTFAKIDMKTRQVNVNTK